MTFWTPEARADLRELALYLAMYDPAIARKAAFDLFARANRLAVHPDMGRPGVEFGTRELSAPQWNRVIVYRQVADRIEVLALRDTRRNTSQPEN